MHVLWSCHNKSGQSLCYLVTYNLPYHAICFYTLITCYIACCKPVVDGLQLPIPNTYNRYQRWRLGNCESVWRWAGHPTCSIDLPNQDQSGYIHRGKYCVLIPFWIILKIAAKTLWNFFPEKTYFIFKIAAKTLWKFFWKTYFTLIIWNRSKNTWKYFWNIFILYIVDKTLLLLFTDMWLCFQGVHPFTAESISVSSQDVRVQLARGETLTPRRRPVYGPRVSTSYHTIGSCVLVLHLASKYLCHILLFPNTCVSLLSFVFLSENHPSPHGCWTGTCWNGPTRSSTYISKRVGPKGGRYTGQASMVWQRVLHEVASGEWGGD